MIRAMTPGVGGQWAELLENPIQTEQAMLYRHSAAWNNASYHFLGF